MNTRSFISRVLALAVLVFGFSAAPVFAQQYKEDFNATLELAQEGLAALEAQNISEAEATFSEAYSQFADIAAAAAEAGDEGVANQSEYLAAQLAYKAGRVALQQETYSSAGEHFDAGIAVYPAYAKNFLGRALALQRSDQIEPAMDAFVETMEVARANGDYEAANKAESAIRDHYIYRASQQLAGENPTAAQASAALSNLGTLEEYVELQADAYYYMAVANDIEGDYQAAVALADQALELHTGSRVDSAKIYFIKGESLMRLGQTSAALAAFQNASYGPYEASARHYIEQLSNT